jgi:hypothetical protein
VARYRSWCYPTSKSDSLYDTDVLAWSETQADLLRRLASGQHVNDVDWENVVEEIADVGNAQPDAVQSLLRQAMLHLLKIHLWPEDLARMHWQLELMAFLGSSSDRFAPSMRQRLDIQSIWKRARTGVARDIADNPAFKVLPSDCPWTLDDLLDGGQDTLQAALQPHG